MGLVIFIASFRLPSSSLGLFCLQPLCHLSKELVVLLLRMFLLVFGRMMMVEVMSMPLSVSLLGSK
jgi:hypothetical protein